MQHFCHHVLHFDVECGYQSYWVIKILAPLPGKFAWNWELGSHLDK